VHRELRDDQPTWPKGARRDRKARPPSLCYWAVAIKRPQRYAGSEPVGVGKPTEAVSARRLTASQQAGMLLE